MTPSGSFHGSKRETWQISGRSTSMPNCWQTYERVLRRERHVLRRERVDRRRHDVHGARPCPRGRSSRRGTATAGSRGCTAAAARSSPGSASRRRCGSARPSDCAFSGTSWNIAAGCGSWTMHASQPAVELARVHLVVALPDVPLLLGQVLGRALERVVHELGRVEELLAPVDDLPLALQARRPS